MICPLCKEDVRSSVGLLGLVRHLIETHQGFRTTAPPYSAARARCPCGFTSRYPLISGSACGDAAGHDEHFRGESDLEGHFLALPNFGPDPMGAMAHHFAEARLKP